MPVINMDLEDGLEPISFTIRNDEIVRFQDFMAEMNQDMRDVRRYRWLREWSSGTRLDVFKNSATKSQLDEAIDAAMAGN